MEPKIPAVLEPLPTTTTRIGPETPIREVARQVRIAKRRGSISVEEFLLRQGRNLKKA